MKYDAKDAVDVDWELVGIDGASCDQLIEDSKLIGYVGRIDKKDYIIGEVRMENGTPSIVYSHLLPPWIGGKLSCELQLPYGSSEPDALDSLKHDILLKLHEVITR